MKVLITGSAGFIGSALALRLLERGDAVIGVDNLNDYYDVNLKKARLARNSAFDGYLDVRADIYSEDEKFVKSVVLRKGDVMTLINGAHGYEILEPHTQVLEIKNGPFLGPERDRRRIFTT